MGFVEMTTRTRPTVAVLALGGTIASVPDTGGAGTKPSLTAEDLLAAVPDLGEVAEVHGTSFRQSPSGELLLQDLFALAAEVRRRVEAGAHGVVVTQGTDTLEETAFALDLLCDIDAPIVVTGAMRTPRLPGADGPANLLAAVRVAVCPEGRGLGCLVVFNDEIHAARFVQKTHTSNPATFCSALTGPIGWITEGRVRIAAQPSRRPRLPVREDARPPSVPVLTLALGDDTGLVEHVSNAEYDGVVLEAYGGGHVPERFVAAVEQTATRIPVVLASRTGSGEMLRRTYGFPGSERDLLSRGLFSAGALDGLKARLLLAVLLARDAGWEQITQTFTAIGYGGSSA